MIESGRGSIIAIGALSALKGAAGMSAYIVSKNAGMRLPESLSAELKGHGINVNAVLPSIIDTPVNRADMPDADFSKWVTPDELTNVICFPGSDLARGVHRALIPVAGLS
jgi:NAD(P)-dependent dehydrogenase (short-subunit alcohol dehydrogenase family)